MNDKTLFVIALMDILIFIHHIKCDVTDVNGFPLQNLITDCNSQGYSFPEAEGCMLQMFRINTYKFIFILIILTNSFL